jgi:hypothetical protein
MTTVNNDQMLVSALFMIRPPVPLTWSGACGP